MRVLVSGAAGMLGHALRSSVPEGVEPAWVDIDEMDISDPGSVAAALDGARPEAVINCSAYTNVDGCESHEADALAVNGTGATLLAEGCAAREVPLVHISTDYVFDGTIQSPGCYAEEDHTHPMSAYGRTKLAGEQGVRAAGPLHWIVRTQWLYGLDGPNFVETMLRVAAERDVLTVVDDQVGSPTSTHDLAPALWDIVCRRPAFGIYHAVNSGSCSWFEFAREIFRQSGVEVRVAPMDSSQLDRPAPRPARSVLSTDKLRAALGTGFPAWEDALRRYLLLRTSTEVTS
jgi:dTDP-4-dehydrorhamnose reductase